MNHEPMPAQGPVDVTVSRADTYEKPHHGWTCFHCGETFTTVGGAQDHFGAQPTAKPGCLVKVSLGGERGLLKALREAEETIARYVAEDTDLHRALYRMQIQHSDALRDAEEAGYERGLRDGMHLPANAKVSGGGTASAGLPGYAAGGNGERE